ncbi:MAG: glycoside hydrolase domain-containing protein [Planctomycetota bacterium]
MCAWHYPGFQRLAVVIEPGRVGGEDIRSVQITARGPAGEMRPTEAHRRSDGSWKALIALNSESEGRWSVDIAALGPGNKEILNKEKAFYFDKKRWEWENNSLGLSDEVIPPFTPMKVRDHRVECILRSHTMNGLGLWDQVSALGKDIFAAPMTVDCHIAGKRQEWNARPLEFVEQSDHKVVVRAVAAAGPLVWEAFSTFDYDGFMWVKVALKSETEVKVDRLTLRVPMKAAECVLMHAVADRIRKNKAGLIPSGAGEMWNSSGVPKYELKGKRIIPTEMIPYIWLGAEERGLCWCADSSLGFSLEDGTPAARLLRPSPEVVVAEIDLINRPTEIRKERILEFGLQATPVKPLPEGWKNWRFDWDPQRRPGVLNIPFPVDRWGCSPSGFAKYSVLYDYSYFRFLHNMTRTHKPAPNFLDAWRHTLFPVVEAWVKDNEAWLQPDLRSLKPGQTLSQFRITNITNHQEMWKLHAPNMDRLVLYTDPRLEAVGIPETDAYTSEWWSPQIIGYSGCIRTFPTPSHINFMLWHFKRTMEAGIDGLYFDDQFLMPCDNPDTLAAIGEDGKIHPRIGILAMRQLVKRVAVLQHELKKEPRLFVMHMTNAMLVPCYSFATISFDWEMDRGEADFQDRFTDAIQGAGDVLDFIRAESTGRQAGLVPVVLAEIENKSDVGPEEWKKTKTRLTRSALAVTLLHEIQLNRHYSTNQDWSEVSRVYAILRRFGVADDNCEFVPYWTRDASVSVTGGNFRASFYKRPSRLLIIVSNISEAAAACVNVDGKALQLPAGSVWVDVESEKKLEPRDGHAASIVVPRHDFRVVFVGPADTVSGPH